MKSRSRLAVFLGDDTTYVQKIKLTLPSPLFRLVLCFVPPTTQVGDDYAKIVVNEQNRQLAAPVASARRGAQSRPKAQPSIPPGAGAAAAVAAAVQAAAPGAAAGTSGGGSGM